MNTGGKHMQGPATPYANTEKLCELNQDSFCIEVGEKDSIRSGISIKKQDMGTKILESIFFMTMVSLFLG